MFVGEMVVEEMVVREMVVEATSKARNTETKGETQAEREREQHQNNKRGVDLDSEYPARAAPVCGGWV